MLGRSKLTPPFLDTNDFGQARVLPHKSPLPLRAALPYKGNLSLRLWRNWQTR
jgi:hypothetical protein